VVGRATVGWYVNQVLTGTWTGGYLRKRLGRRYVSIGAVFHEGAGTSDYTQPSPHPVGPPPPGLLEATLGPAARPDYLPDLHAPAPGPVRDWLYAPATMRMLPPDYKEDDGSGYTMSVDALASAFDAITHIHTTTPSRLLVI
jgi:erythromycin esterase